MTSEENVRNECNVRFQSALVEGIETVALRGRHFCNKYLMATGIFVTQTIFGLLMCIPVKINTKETTIRKYIKRTC